MTEIRRKTKQILFTQSSRIDFESFHVRLVTFMLTFFDIDGLFHFTLHRSNIYNRKIIEKITMSR